MISLSRPGDICLKLRLIFLVFLFLSAAFGTQAAEPLEVVINEIAWMGTNVSSSDEWIELYNNTGHPIILDNWQVISQDGTPKINLSGSISAFSFYLIERTDDNTVQDISADKIYSGALGNNGELLSLFDSSGKLIDEVDCSSKWFNGDNSTKQTMERKVSELSGDDAGNWQASQSPGGTPKSKNILAENYPQQESEKTVEANPQQTQKDYPSGIIINEVLPSPEGQDEKEEWIEIFNQNSFEANLSYWQITDLIGQTQSYRFPEGSAIEPEGFFLLFRPTTKITLNNDGDELRLLRPDGGTADSVIYENAPNGESLNRTPSGWIWSSNLTPGKINSISLPGKSEETETLEETGKIDINAAPLKDLVKIVHIGEVRASELISLRPFYSLDNLTRIKGIGDKTLEDIKKQGLAWIDPKLESPKIDEKTDYSEKKTAAITGSLKSFDFAQGKKIPKSLSVFLIALGLAVFSSIIILILKRKIKIVDLPKKIE